MTTFESRAHAALIRAATAGKPFTMDSVWASIKAKPDRDPRCLGGLVVAAHRSGLIQPTVRWVRSGRGCCHGRPMREWVGA